jgi:hypothetical protein
MSWLRPCRSAAAILQTVLDKKATGRLCRCIEDAHNGMSQGEPGLLAELSWLAQTFRLDGLVNQCVAQAFPAGAAVWALPCCQTCRPARSPC